FALSWLRRWSNLVVEAPALKDKRARSESEASRFPMARRSNSFRWRRRSYLAVVRSARHRRVVSFVALLAWFVFKENFDRRIALGMAAITLGGLLLSWSGKPELSAAWGPL